MIGKILHAERPPALPVRALRRLYFTGLMPTVLYKKLMDRLADPGRALCGDVEVQLPVGGTRVNTDDVIGRDIFLYGAYDRTVIAFLRYLFAGQGAELMLDIGANIGNHALWLADSFRQVYCFEPNPRALAYLRSNEKNHANVALFPIGLSDRPGTAHLQQGEANNLGQAHIGDPEAGDTLPITLESGDGFLQERGADRVDFIKIDVEGHEWEVLTGLAGTIRARTPVILLEYHRDTAEKSGFGIEAFLGNYRMYGLVGLPKARQMRSMTEGIILEPFDARSEYNNVLCIPQHRVEEFEAKIPRGIWLAARSCGFRER